MPATTKQVHNVRPELVARGLLVAVGDLHPHPSNPRRGDVEAIAGSLRRFGQMRPIIATQDGTIVAGNHTYQAAVSLGWTHIAATLMEMTAKDEAAYLIADNRHSDMATYDDAALLEHLHVLAADDNLDGVGFEQDDITGLADALAALPDEPLPPEEPDVEPGEEDDEDVPRGSKLALVDVAIAEPKTQLARGDVVRLGRHLLYCEPVFTGHAVWGAALVEDPDRVFVPYPQPTVPLTTRAAGLSLVMVQPDRYLAGHLVDKWISVHGDTDVAITKAAE